MLVGGPDKLPDSTSIIKKIHEMETGVSKYDRISNVNIIPQGGGYNLPDILNVNRVTGNRIN